MRGMSRRAGLTLVETLVLVAVGFFLLLLIMFAIPRSRESSRRTTCLNNLKQINLGFQNMESALKRFPPSVHVKRDAAGNILTPLDGWSWCFNIIPFIETDTIYFDSSDVGPLVDPVGSTRYSEAMGTIIDELHCPSFSGTPFVDAKTKREAITNYKAMAATHAGSYTKALGGTPAYLPNSDLHPDGAIFPGSRHGIKGFKQDGSSLTILVVESREQNVARWTVGVETTLVGLPPGVFNDPTFAIPYAHPQGYTPNAFWEQSTIPPEQNKTYLNWDYDGQTPTGGPYVDGLSDTVQGKAPWGVSPKHVIKYGPSSSHPGVTPHLFADGSVHAISNDIDRALYMFLITRNNGDPVVDVDR